MKHLFSLLILIGLFLQGTKSMAQSRIVDWEPTLPVTEEQVIDVIHIKADESLIANDPEAVKCSGEYDDPELIKYYTYLDEDKNVVHKIEVILVMAKYIGRCQKQAVYSCRAPFTIYSNQTYSLDDWNCKLMNISG